MPLDVCILGAGTLGLSVAINVQTLIPRVKVTVIADKFGRDTLDPMSPGIFLPVPARYKGIDQQLVTDWLLEGWKHHFTLAKSPEGASIGQTLLTGYYMWTDHVNHLMSDAIFNYKKICSIEKFDKNFTYPHVCSFTTVQFDEAKYLNWLMKEYRGRGGKLISDTVDCFQQLYGSYDVVVNCVGRRGREFVADPHLVPIKGHKMQVEAPWAKNFYITEENIMAIPNLHKGGVLDIGYIWENAVVTDDPDPDVSELMLNKIKSQIHRLMGCKILKTWQGIKPYRYPPRIETEMLNCSGPLLPVIHCIGLGPDALTITWGLGVYVAHLVQDVQRKIQPTARMFVPFGRLI